MSCSTSRTAAASSGSCGVRSPMSSATARRQPCFISMSTASSRSTTATAMPRASVAPAPRREDGAMTSGDDVGRDLIFDELDAIAQLQLALLQALQLQQVSRGRVLQCRDRRIEIAMFLAQPCQLFSVFAVV